MSSTIDWSKAPEGATHYLHESPSWFACWVKESEAGYYTWLDDGVDGQWDIDTNFDECVGLLVPRPTEPQEPTPWDGEGLPPVGTVCEFRWGVAAWKRCTVFAHRPNANGGIDALVDIECDWTFSSSPTRFRPIKSAEQIAAEERGAAINEMVNVWRRTMGRFAVEEHGLAEMLYDAGYRKAEQP